MNTERLNELANYLEALPGNLPEIGFNMGSFWPDEGWIDKTGHFCDTCCCIAGHTLIMVGSAPKLEPGYGARISEDAAGYLGLTCSEAGSLFAPDNIDYHELNLERAITTIRHAAKHGEIDWKSND